MSFNSINKITLLGRLGRDPDIKTMSNDKKVASFSIATSESYTDKQGEKREITDWHNIVVFNQPMVKIIESYVTKGSRLFIEGALKTRKWTDKTGNDRYTTEVVLSGVDCRCILIDKKQSEVPSDVASFGKDQNYQNNQEDDYESFSRNKGGAERGGDDGTEDLIPF